MSNFEEKCQKLINVMDDYAKKDIVIAFSGGVDSSLLLTIACDSAIKYESEVYAVTFQSSLNTVKEINFTIESAEKNGAIHKIIKIDPINEAGIINNPKNRCYLCKKYMFLKLCDFAKYVNTDIILEGTNADDINVYRPGIKAVSELGIKSPLADIGFTKQEVRLLAEKYGISSSNKPSTPCLATRFEYDTELSYEKIRAVEKAEGYMSSFGLYNVRLRVHGLIARIEVDEQDISRVIKYRKDISDTIKKLGFKYVTIDLEGYVSGSMDR